ncbi:MAG: FHA domain-containing protein [Opitutales bacterium]|nr:FHA domain-containing protein [Opitutales bacterium]
MTIEDLVNLLALEGTPSPEEMEKAFATRLGRFEREAANAGSKPERLLAKREIKRLRDAADVLRDRLGEMRTRDLLRRARIRLEEGHPAAARALLQGAASLLPGDPLAPIVLDFREIEAECEAASKERGGSAEGGAISEPEPLPDTPVMPEPTAPESPLPAKEPHPQEGDRRPAPVNSDPPPPSVSQGSRPERPVDVRPSTPPIDRLTWASPATAGFRVHLLAKDCVTFGRDDRTDVLLRAVSPASGGVDWHTTKHISRRHFCIERRGDSIQVVDGYSSPDGQRVFSGNGLFLSGNRVSEAVIPADPPGVLAVTHLPTGPAVPHYRIHALRWATPPSTPSGPVSGEGVAGLFMERLDAVREHVLILWGTVAMSALPLSGVRANSYLARVAGGFLYAEGGRWFCATADASPFRTLEAGKLLFGHRI